MVLTSSSFPLIEEYSLNSIKWISIFPGVLNFNQLFLKLNQFICNWRLVLPIHCTWLDFDAQNLHGCWYDGVGVRTLYLPTRSECHQIMLCYTKGTTVRFSSVLPVPVLNCDGISKPIKRSHALVHLQVVIYDVVAGWAYITQSII